MAALWVEEDKETASSCSRLGTRDFSDSIRLKHSPVTPSFNKPVSRLPAGEPASYLTTDPVSRFGAGQAASSGEGWKDGGSSGWPRLAAVARVGAGGPPFTGNTRTNVTACL
jgi:hypothetical protein